MDIKRSIAILLALIMTLSALTLLSSAQGYDRTNICSDEEWEMLALINKAREEYGLRPLSIMPMLQMGSGLRAKEMSDDGKLKNVRPNGKEWFNIFDEIGMEYDSNPIEIRASGSNSPKAIFNALMNKKDEATGNYVYRNRLLDENFGHIGVGLDNSGKLANVWSIIFTDCKGYDSLQFTAPEGDTAHSKCGTPAEDWDIIIGGKCTHGNSYFPLTSSMIVTYESEKIGKQNVTFKVGDTSFTDTVYNDFADVVNGSWYYNGVTKAFDSALFSGTGAGNFSPNTPMTRAMFVVVLSKIAGVDTSKYGVSGFKDVPASSWYTKPVTWASQYGIVGGTAPTTFSPDSSVTREQICVMLKAYVDKMGVSAPEVNPLKTFKDDGKISSWAKGAVYFCQRHGFVAGDNSGNFNPANPATRAQVAVIAVNFNESIVK